MTPNYIQFYNRSMYQLINIHVAVFRATEVPLVISNGLGFVFVFVFKEIEGDCDREEGNQVKRKAGEGKVALR